MRRVLLLLAVVPGCATRPEDDCPLEYRDGPVKARASARNDTPAEDVDVYFEVIDFRVVEWRSNTGGLGCVEPLAPDRDVTVATRIEATDATPLDHVVGTFVGTHHGYERLYTVEVTGPQGREALHEVSLPGDFRIRVELGGDPVNVRYAPTETGIVRATCTIDGRECPGWDRNNSDPGWYLIPRSMLAPGTHRVAITRSTPHGRIVRIEDFTIP
jgi:hypothetical protein